MSISFEWTVLSMIWHGSFTFADVVRLTIMIAGAPISGGHGGCSGIGNTGGMGDLGGDNVGGRQQP